MAGAKAKNDTSAAAEGERIVVSHRAVLKDPGPAGAPADTPEPSSAPLPSGKVKLAPLTAVTASGSPSEKPAVEATDTSGDTPVDSLGDADSGLAKQSKTEPTEAGLKQAAERAAKLQKMIDEQTYYLPINQVEKRRNKRNAVLGVVFIVILGLAWADVALDSGILTVPGIKAPTHFFK